MNRIIELREIAGQKSDIDYLDIIYTFAKLSAKKGKTEFTLPFSYLTDIDLDRESSQKLSEVICDLLRKSGFKYEVEWTHPDCFLYKYCEKGCKPERIKISY
jgi:hypothetical protein